MAASIKLPKEPERTNPRAVGPWAKGPWAQKRRFSDFRVIFGRFGGRDAVEIAPGGHALHPARVLDHGDFSGPDSGMFCDFRYF